MSRFLGARGRWVVALAHRCWRRLVRLALVAAVLYAVFGIFVPGRFFTLSPGPAPDVATLVELSGAGGAGSDPSGGKFLLTTIEASPATPVQLWSFITERPLVALVPRAYLVPAGMSDAAYDAWSLASMTESQLTATWQAWLFLGRSTRLVSDGGQVFFVDGSGPAAGRVRSGDVIVAWSLGAETVEVVTSDDFEKGVSDAYARLPLGAEPHSLTLRLFRERAPVSVKLALTDQDLAFWPFLGLAVGAAGLRTAPSVLVTFPEGDIGGPSGGLMLALEIVDDFTPGDLTLGRVVAGSGTIGPGGLVGPVGGVNLKVAGAAAAGAGVFLVSDEDYEEARQAVADQRLIEFRVIPVGSLAEAYQALVSLTGKNGADYNRADLPPVLEQAFGVALRR